MGLSALKYSTFIILSYFSETTRNCYYAICIILSKLDKKENNIFLLLNIEKTKYLLKKIKKY